MKWDFHKSLNIDGHTMAVKAQIPELATETIFILEAEERVDVNNTFSFIPVFSNTAAVSYLSYLQCFMLCFRMSVFVEISFET